MKSLQQYQINEVIIKENDIDEYLYLIKSGSVSVTKNLDGQEIKLATLNIGSFFGEMALIDEKPRTATVTALEETILEVFHRDSFLALMQKDEHIAVKFLSGIFSRLRDANAKVDNSLININNNEKEDSSIKNVIINIEGITEKAKLSLPDNPSNLLINQTIFTIGRISNDPFSNNNLELHDNKPLQISRNHLSLQLIDNKVAIFDIGSSLGLRLNGMRIGGTSKFNGPLNLENENKLILGSDNSQLEYKINIL